MGYDSTWGYRSPATRGRKSTTTCKKIVGRKRHIVVDTDGCLLMVNLTATDIFDSAGAHIDSNHTSRHSPSLGGRTHFRLDDPLAPPGTRL